MEEEPTSAIRESTRNLLKLNRRFQRDKDSDVRRCMKIKRVTSENILQIANRLKTRTSISFEELKTLKNGLMEDPNYIELVLNTHGALRGLVREISGADVHKQSAATGCLCNLALGDSKAGFTITKAAGPYLTAALDSLSSDLAVTCAWTIGNLAGSGTKACTVLIAQGALTKLCGLINSNNEEIQDAALYGAVHFTYQLKDELGIEHVNKILQALYKIPISTTSLQLLFTLSCHKDFNISDEYLLRILQVLIVSIDNYLKDCQCNNLLYLIRILANISINENVYTLYVNVLSQYATSLHILLRRDDDLSMSLFWLIGNICNYCSDNILFTELLKK